MIMLCFLDVMSLFRVLCLSGHWKATWQIHGEFFMGSLSVPMDSFLVFLVDCFLSFPSFSLVFLSFS